MGLSDRPTVDESTELGAMTAVRSEGRHAVVSLAALVLLTGVAVAAIDRLFTTGAWWPGAITVALIGHGLSWLARRMGLRLWVSVPIALIAVALTTTWFALAATTAGGMPTAATFTGAVDALRAASDGLARQPFPAPMLPGDQLVGMLAVGSAALAADVVAFRLRAAMWAAVPSLALVCSAVAVARPGAVYAWTIAYVGAVGVFWLTHRFALRAGGRVQFTGASGSARPITPTGVAFTALCVVAAVGIAPLLPRDSNFESVGMDRQSVVSPLLAIRALMSRDATVEQFTVASAVARHWRLTALDVYDGSMWAGSFSFKREDGALESDWPHPDGSALHADFTIQHLDSPWLPSAYVPRNVSGRDIGWDGRSESLFSPPDRSTPTQYALDATVPHFNSADLRAVEPLDISREDFDRYTQLPEMPEDVFTLMRDITFGAGTLFDRAIALQNHLRTFTVGDAPVGHSLDALRTFLFTTHQGTSEQFAAAFAVLARAADVPARVVVGFMPGDHLDDGLWHVEGRHAEAWAEVLLGPYGWVPFQPMPGAGIPGGVEDGESGSQDRDPSLPPEQADVRQDPNGTPVEQNRPADPTPSTTVPPEMERIRESGVLGAMFGVALLLAIGWVVLVPVIGVLRVRWRRRSARTHAEAVLVAFDEIVERLADAGCPRRPSETVVEHAARAARSRHVRSSADDLHALAHHTATVLYRAGTTSVTATDARALATRVKRDVATSVPSWHRVRWALDPRRPTPAGRTWRRRSSRAHRKDVRRGR